MRKIHGYAAMAGTSEDSAPGSDGTSKDDSGPWPGNTQSSSLYTSGEEGDFRVDQSALHALHELLGRTRLQAHNCLVEDDRHRAAIEQACGEPPRSLPCNVNAIVPGVTSATRYPNTLQIVRCHMHNEQIPWKV